MSWIARFVSLVFLLLACFALPQHAAADHHTTSFGGTTWTISDAEPVDEGGTARFRVSPEDEGSTNRQQDIPSVTYTFGSAELSDLGSDRPITYMYRGDNSSTYFLEVPIADDDIAEGEETFTVVLSFFPAFLGFATTIEATGTINASDGGGSPPPTTAPDLTVGDVSVSSASVVEGASFTINATVNNEGDAASAATTLTYYRSADATITTGDTSIATDPIGALAASGSSTQDASVSIATAGTYHVGACVPTVSGETDTDNNCSTGVEVTVTAAAVDAVINLSAVADVSEAANRLNFRVDLDPQIDEDVTVAWAVTGGTATAADFDQYASSGTVVISADQGNARIRFRPVDDDLVEDSETLELTISADDDTPLPDGVTIGTATATGTLTDNDEAVAPAITTQPTDQSVTVGENATFTVAATGTPTPTYQWRLEGSDISGATSASYTLSSAALTNAGDYTVVVTNTAGTVTSSAATLTVTAAAVAPQITTQPTDQSVTVGGSATFTVTATGTPTPTYQWRFEGSDISGATSASYTLSNAALTNAGDYTVVVTNTAGTVTSNAATLTVTAAAVAPEITTQPTDQSVTVGGSATFTVTATGTPTPTYQWRFEGSDISGATSETYTLSGAALTNAGDYTVVVTNTAGTVTSSAATLTVTAAAAPDLTVDGVSVSSASVVEGASFTINATVNNEGDAASAATTLTYYRSADATITTGDTSIATDAVGALAASGSSTQDASVSIATAGTYHVGACVPTVSGETDTDNNCSTGVQVTVTAAAVAPQITTQPTDQSVTVGDNATFTVAATGTPTPTYQWRFDGSDISGATSETYTLSNAALTNAGDYTVVVTNTAGTVTSSAATLTVTAAAVAPQITTQPTDQSVTVGENATFTVAATGTPTPTYQWRFEGSDIAGATSASYTLSNAALTNAGDYTVVVTNTAGEVTSTAATLTVTAAVNATVSIAAASAVENVSGGNAEFTVSLSEAVNEDVTLAVAYAVGDTNPVVLATDLGTRPDTVTIDQGQTSATLLVPIIDDSIVESDETFTVTISEGTTPLPTGVTIGTDDTATGTITNDDTAVLGFTGPTIVFPTEGTTSTFTVSFLSSGATSAAVPVTLTWTVVPDESDDDPGQPADLNPSSGTVTIQAGQSSADITITAVDDTQDEPFAEALLIQLGLSTTSPLPEDVSLVASSNAAYERDVRVVDNDDPPDITVSIGDISVAENVSGGNAQFTITLSETLLDSIGFTLTFEPGDTNPVVLADDLGDLPTEVAFIGGTLTRTFTVPIIDDELVEGDETFTVTIASRGEGGNITFTKNTATGTIIDNDDPPPPEATVSIGNASVAENDGNAEFTVSLTQAVESDVTVAVAYTDGTATLATDLGTRPTTVTINEGDTEATLEVPVTNDNIVEGNEDFTVTISEGSTALPEGVTIGTTATGTGTITDNDEAEITLGPATLEAAENETFTYTVSLSKAADEAVTVRWTATDGTASVDDDLQEQTDTVTFDANDNTAQEFTISPVDDPDDEVNETFTVTLEADTAGTNPLPTGVTIGASNSSTATITDNDDRTGPDLTVDGVSVSSASVVEGASFTINATVNNGGNAASAATTLTYYRSTDATITTGDTSIATDPIAILAASGSSTQDASVSIAAAGTYHVGACVPTVSGETDTDNNCSTGVQVTVTAAAVAPQITTQPTNQSVTVGGSATFTVVATGTPTPTYQWRFDGSDISGATSASYTLSGAALTDAGDYTVVVTNTAGTVTSTAATLTVTPAAVAPQITTQPTDQSVTVGGSATFTVTATGTPTPTYQWRFEGSDISGATSASYTLSNAALTNAGDYTVVVTNTAGTVTSTAATLTVTAAAVAPQITTQPTDQSVTVGENATFTVTATGTPTPTYQWRLDGSDIAGATSASYAISNAALTNAGDYTVVVTNTAGSVTSSVATLTVTAAAVAPQITTQPTDRSVTVGENATFTVTATGTPTPTYQWRFDGSDISGATSASYTLSNAALTNAGDYTVVVTNTAGAVTSNAATLTVTAAAVAPQITTQPTDQSVTVGGSATFTVTATGTPTPTYQWRFEGSDIAGATSASYTLSGAALTNAGDYTVVVTNTAGTVTSSVATLTVTAAAVAPQITTQPTDQSVTVGENATFTVTATGTPTPTYQWRFDGSDIAGATSASYTLSNAALTNAGDYTVVVTNTAGTVTSSAATLTVTPAAVAPQITTQPTNQSVTVGENATFTVTATGTPTPTYQWRFEGSDISGATSASYTLSNAALTNAGDYTVVVTNTAGTVTSNAATLTVTAAPPATAPDLTVGSVSVSSASVVEGVSFTINATVNNEGDAASAATTLTYYRSADATITTGDTSIGTDAVGALAASGSSTQDASVSIATAGTYHVGACVPTVSGETDTDNNCSTGVQVTVTAAAVAPQITTQPTDQSVTVGENATFTVTATGTPTPTYQWRFDGSDISGATSASYTLSNAALTNAGDYTVVVTNTAGTVTSSAATLTVTPAAVAPQITTQPTDQSVTVGETATFTVAATGTPTPTYQWRFDGSDISGATSASYTLSNAALTNAGDYTVVVTNTAGTVTSSAATLTVNDEAAPPASKLSVLIEPRLIGAGTALRRHAGRFDRMTGTVVRNRLDGREMRRLSGSKDLGDGALAVGGSFDQGRFGQGNWGAWIDGAWAGFDGKATGRQADIHGGVDYLTPDGNWLIGALIGHEVADLDIGRATYRSQYTHVGVYGGARLWQHLLFDGAVSYGRATPDITLGDVSASHDAHRITARGALTGDFGLEYGLWTGSVRIEPQLGLLYSRERLGAFTDSAGGVGQGETLELGRFSAGPRLTWDFDGGRLTGGARMQWDFLELEDGVDGQLSGAADIGVTLDLAPNVTLGVQGDVDGIGIGDGFGSIGGTVEFKARF